MDKYKYSSLYSQEKDAVCGVSVYHHHGQSVLILTELPENHGTSITNHAEFIHKQICHDYQLDPHATIFIEHYGPSLLNTSDEGDTYDRVFFTVSPKGEFSHTEWERLTPGELQELIGVEPPRVDSPEEPTTPPPTPQVALAKAQVLLPADKREDYYYLPLALICANSGFEWLLAAALRGEDKETILPKLSRLSSGEYVLAIFGLHLFNDVYQLPQDGLLNLRLLDDWHFELMMQAIRIHSRGLK